jgi:hypothetical protein
VRFHRSQDSSPSGALTSPPLAEKVTPGVNHQAPGAVVALSPDARTRRTSG